MFKHRFDEFPEPWVVWHWFLLSFNGGYINAGGFLATGKFVSHVTGFATLFGVDIAKREIHPALGVVSVPLFFLAGAFIAGLLIDRPIFRGQSPHFDWVMGLSSFCLLFAALAGEFRLFGDFNEVMAWNQSYLLMVLLCLACGLQNGAITSSSGRTVRTTHLTGLTTDLGLGLARIFTLASEKLPFVKELRASYLRMGSIFSFVFGSAIGAWIFLAFGYRGFLLSGIISAYVAWHGRKDSLT